MIILKRFFAWFCNPNGVQNKKGIAINDFKRRRETKQVVKDIKSGKLKLSPKIGGKRRYKVSIVSKGVDLKGIIK